MWKNSSWRDTRLAIRTIWKSGERQIILEKKKKKNNQEKIVTTIFRLKEMAATKPLR